MPITQKIENNGFLHAQDIEIDEQAWLTIKFQRKF